MNGRIVYLCEEHGTHYGKRCCESSRRAFPDTTLDQSLEEHHATSPESILQILERAQETVRDREARYGSDGYWQLADVMMALFPDGISLQSEAECARFYLLEKIVEKLCRYVRSYAEGGHEDSIHDLGVYAFKMEEHDARNRHGR